jgi:hypothetical protein
LIGWARGQERAAEEIETIESALARLDARRAQARRPYYLGLLAELYGAAGHRDRAAGILDGAIRMALERGDVWWLPALYLQRGEMAEAPERETAYRQALELARVHRSCSLERRILASTAAGSA